MNKKASAIIIVVLVVLILLGVGGYMGSQLMKYIPSSNITPTVEVNLSDIDRSGAADESDRIMIRGQIDCIKEQPCWDKTVGKTKDGDNPLYTFDLDLDKDGTITQKDVDLVK
ncbi:MAG: hypothetical protein WCQ41_09595 [Bacillota bacterium]